MPISGNITLITVSGTYVDYEGNPIAGQIIFTLSETLRNQIADQIVVPSSIYATLDSNGSFSVVLPATNDPEFSSIFVYTVTEAFTGGRTYTISLPEGGATRNIADLAPTGTFPVYTPLVSSSTYNVMNTQVQTMDPKIDQANSVFLYPSPTYAFINYRTYAEIISYGYTYAQILANAPIVGNDLARGNLVPNPSFETDTSGWSTGGCTIARTTAQFRVGGASLAMTCNVAGDIYAVPSQIVVSANTPYTFSAFIRSATVTRNARVQIDWYTSASVYISSSAGTAATTSTSDWTRYSITVTSPATAGKANILVLVTAAALNEVHFADAVLFEQSSSLGTYIEGDSYVTQMQTQATNATNSNSTVTTQFGIITTANAERLDDFLILGA